MWLRCGSDLVLMLDARLEYLPGMSLNRHLIDHFKLRKVGVNHPSVCVSMSVYVCVCVTEKVFILNLRVKQGYSYL